MIPQEAVTAAANLLLLAAPTGSQVILFGSQANGTADGDSDVDFLVVEPEVPQRRAEMVRLRHILRPLRIPADVVVVSRAVFEEWKDVPNTLIHDAAREGRTYGIAA